MYQIERVTKDGTKETMYVSGGPHNTVYAKSPHEMLAKTDSFREESLTVNGACSLWLKKQAYFSYDNYQTYKEIYAKYISDFLGSKKIVDLKKRDVKALYKILITAFKLDLAPMQDVDTVLYQILQFSIGLERKNPAEGALADARKEQTIF